MSTGTIEILQADITTLDVDAIVNAANSGLRGGGGVDGAIHRAAGPELLAACRKIGGCPTGHAVRTPGFRLKARFVIHAVGPVYKAQRDAESARLLASCYRRSLEIAREHALESVAFPGISTGIYGYPIDAAATISVAAVLEFLRVSALPGRVIFCTFGDVATKVMQEALRAALLHADSAQ